jgi:hypothetical protein
MTKKYFKYWNWEFDFGEIEISGPETDSRYAVAFYDYWKRLYRVELHNVVAEDDCIFIYDYFCDDAGNIIEKRALEEDGTTVDLIIRITYDAHGKRSREHCWSAKDGGPPVSDSPKDNGNQ